ncbi:MAG: hypothetical protein WKF59_26775 [Chitinophagaceae bacterium]
MLYKKQNKSDHWVVIPLRDEAITILNDRFNNNVSVLTNVRPVNLGYLVDLRSLSGLASIALITIKGKSYRLLNG